MILDPHATDPIFEGRHGMEGEPTTAQELVDTSMAVKDSHG